MYKKLNKSLILSASALLLFSIGAMNSTSINAKRRIHNIHIHRVVRLHHHIKKHNHKWHMGVPKFLRKNSYWVSNFSKVGDSYTKTVTSFGKRLGYNPTPYWYNKHHHFTDTGDNNGNNNSVNPHYRILGHNRYLVISGVKKKHSLHKELHRSKTSDMVIAIIKTHGYNHFSLWSYDRKNSRKHYIGYFTRHAFNHHSLRRALKIRKK